MARTHNAAAKAASKQVAHITLTGDIKAIKTAIVKGSINVDILGEGSVTLKNQSKKLNKEGKQTTEEFGSVDWSKVSLLKTKKEAKKS